MRTALVNGRVLAGERIVNGHTLLLSGGRIEALVDPEDSRCRDAAVVDLGGRLLLLHQRQLHRRAGQRRRRRFVQR